MDFFHLKNAVFIGFFLAFMIGPVFFKLIQTSILKGVRHAIAFDLGVILGDVSFILIAYFGSRPFLKEIKNDPKLFIVGGIILIIYGLITVFSKDNKKESDDEIKLKISSTNEYLKLFLGGFLLNFINVGVLAFWLGLIVVIGPALDMNSTSIFWYFTIIIISYFVTDIGKILLAKQLKHKLTPKVVLQIKKIMGIILIVFGVFMTLKGFIPKSDFNFDSYIETPKN
ncbi:LysE family translocator [Wenyingzhuangia marina]|uniref:Threonine/homoserine/homoserine lactone efflux protein n=1 Tax=Wenyingzhuangia marina TaxID=1195760 RepID=A0A1M5V5K3_9FLAO|nr:LysE family transporter [Wenyingzhuangia marina]SHH70511.1 Threonine/homoserine/homoserine lactone efflux protein [Wenyingzhuangia marina]